MYILRGIEKELLRCPDCLRSTILKVYSSQGNENKYCIPNFCFAFFENTAKKDAILTIIGSKIHINQEI